MDSVIISFSCLCFYIYFDIVISFTLEADTHTWACGGHLHVQLNACNGQEQGVQSRAAILAPGTTRLQPFAAASLRAYQQQARIRHRAGI